MTRARRQETQKSAPKRGVPRSAVAAARSGIGASIRNNFTAYGFSIMITATLAVIASRRGAPTAGDVFLLILGSTSAFTALEAAASGGFKHGVRGEPTDVLALGTAFNLVSVAAAVGCATGLAAVTGDDLAWLACPFVATAVYVVGSGFELALAEHIKRS